MTWRELFEWEDAVPPDILRWWLSDRMELPLTRLPLDAEVNPGELECYRQDAARLRRGEPVQYVCGRAPFRELTLKVDSRVLIPRPETEQLVQLALDNVIQPGDRVLDVGCGSGCIALAVKQARPDCRVEGVDLSEGAVDLARENARALGLDVTFRVADLCGAEAPGSREVILANLPYVAEEERGDLPHNVREYEPEQALFAEDRGTALICRLLREAGEVLTPGGRLCLESGERQGGWIRGEAERHGWAIESRPDLAGRERFWFATRYAGPF